MYYHTGEESQHRSFTGDTNIYSIIHNLVFKKFIGITKKIRWKIDQNVNNEYFCIRFIFVFDFCMWGFLCVQNHHN